MDFKNHVPIYIQIIDGIKKELIAGKLHPGDKLESVRDYAAKLKVNPNTVQKAYQEMERMNMAYTKRGIGRFIVESDTLVSKLQQEMSVEVVNEFLIAMKAIGYSHEAIIAKVKELLQEE